MQIWTINASANGRNKGHNFILQKNNTNDQYFNQLNMI